MENENFVINWFWKIIDSLPTSPKGYAWSDGNMILCATEGAADCVADIIEALYLKQGREVTVCTGYYDPVEDKRQREEDRYTGWWYVELC